jgi:hypothetical protein
MSKYAPLTRHLKAFRTGHVAMAFGEVEAVLGFDLPKSARRHRPWWSNEAGGSHAQARAWLNAGFRVSEVDMEAERLVFVRLNATDEPATTLDHPLWGALRGTVTIAPGVDLTEPLWDMEATERSLDQLAQMLADDAR